MTPQEIELAKLHLQQNQIYLQALIGLVTALIGIGGVYFGQFVFRRSEQRKALDAFWYKYAITEGVGPLLEYAYNLEERVWYQYQEISGAPGSVRNTEPLTIPMAALRRTIRLLECNEIMNLALNAESDLKNSLNEDEIRLLVLRTLLLRDFLEHFHGMFLVAAIQEPSDIMLTGSRPPVQFLVSIFRKCLLSGRNLTSDEIKTIKNVSSFDIFTDISNLDKHYKRMKKKMPSSFTMERARAYRSKWSGGESR